MPALSAQAIHLTTFKKPAKIEVKQALLFAFLLCCLFFTSINQLFASGVRLGKVSGGNGGVPFVDMMAPGGKMASITIRSGKFIDSIQINYRYGRNIVGIPHGGKGGVAKTFSFARGEYITKFGGRSGKYVDSIYIRTNKGRSMRWGGRGGENRFAFTATAKTPITGIWGKSGSFVDAIGIIGKATLNRSTTGNLAGFKPKSAGGSSQDCGKCDGAPTTYFPRPPRSDQDKAYWINQNKRLGRIIRTLGGHTVYLRDENALCGPNLHCQINTRGRAIAFATGAE